MSQDFKIEPEDEPMRVLGYVVMGLKLQDYRDEASMKDQILTGICKSVSSARTRLKSLAQEQYFVWQGTGAYDPYGKGWRPYQDRNLRIVELVQGATITVG